MTTSGPYSSRIIDRARFFAIKNLVLTRSNG